MAITFNHNDQVYVNDGKLGIGTASPSEALHIYRNAASAEIRLQNNTISSYIRSNTDNLNFYVSNGEKMRITSAGNVGIGTTSPPRKLSVETNDTATYSASVNASEISIARKNSSNTAGQVAAISLNATGWSGSTTGVVVLNAIARQGNFSNADFAIQNRVGGSFVETFRITTYGNVGIGTDTPDDNVNTGAYFKPDGGGKFLTVKDSSGSFIMLESSTTTNDDQIGGIYFNNTVGQADAHVHVAGIDAVLHKHGTNDALSGGDLRFFTKPSGSGVNGPRMVILQNGNVGIGTTSPTRKLHVVGGSTYAALLDSDQDYTLGLARSGTEEWWLKTYTDGRFAIHENGVGDKVTIKAGGNVGIGTTSPGAKLDVNGTGIAATPTVSIVNTSSSSFNHTINALAPNLAAGENNIFVIGKEGNTKNAGYIGYTWNADANNSNVLTFGHWASDNLMNLTGDGKLGIGTTSPSQKLHVVGNVSATGLYYNGSGAELRIDNSYGGGIGYYADQNGHTFNTWLGSWQPRMTITDAGNVGIGTTSPATKLDVDGFAKFAKHYREGGFSALGATVDDWYTIADFSLNSATFTYENFKGTVNWGYGGSTSWYAVEFDVYFRGNNSIAADGAYVRWSYRQTGNAEGKGGSAIRIIRSDDVTYEVQISPITNYGVVNWEVVSPKYSSAITLTTHDTLQTASTALSSSKIVQDSNFYVNGKVGIGTTSVPSEANLSLAAKTTTEGGHLVINKATSSTHATHIDNNTDTFRIMKGTDSASGSVQFILNHTNGNVGIGTTSPGYPLEVRSASPFITANSTGTGNSGFAMLVNAGSNGVGVIATDNGGGLTFDNGATGAAQSEKMRITSDGKVGIGTTSPDHKLTVYTDATSGVELVGQDGGNQNSDSSKIIFNGYVQDNGPFIQAINTASYGIKRLGFFANRTASDYTTLPTESMSITNTGNVGIGTTSPTRTLHVAGTGRFTDNLYSTSTDVDGIKTRFLSGAANNSTNNGTLYLQYGKSNPVSIGETGSSDLYVAGNVGIGTTSPTAPLDVVGVRAGRDWALSNRANIRLDSNGTGSPADILFGHTAAANQTSWSGVYWALSSRGTDDGNKFHFYRGGGNPGGNEAVAMTIASDLNVGIGTNSPNTKLHVSGSIKAEGNGTDQYFFEGVRTGVGTTIRIYDNANTAYIDSYNNMAFRANQNGGSGGNFRFTGGNVGIGTENPSYGLDVNHNSARIGSSTQTTTSLYLTATNTAGAPAVATEIIMQGYEGRAKGTFYTDSGVDGEWFDGIPYNGSHNYWQVGFDETGGQAEYLANAKLTVRDNGNVGIGTTSPEAKLHVSASSGVAFKVNANNTAKEWYIDTTNPDHLKKEGNLNISADPTAAHASTKINFLIDGSNKMRIQDNGNVGISTTSPSYTLDVTGTIRATGDVIAYSDARVKENVETIPNALDKVKSMRGVVYNKIDEEKRSVGVIAQELLEVVPEAVHQDEKGMYSVAYGNLVGVLVEAMKEQQQQIDELKAKLDGITK